MNLKQLQYFWEFSKSKSITQTAARLYITQQGLSRAIHTLENELGCPLIQQDGGKVILTNYGELWAKHCAIIQEDVKRIYADLEQARSTAHQCRS